MPDDTKKESAPAADEASPVGVPSKRVIDFPAEPPKEPPVHHEPKLP